MLEIKIIHLCYNDTQYIQYHNTVFRLGLRNLLPTEATVTWEKWVIASGKLQTDATASPNPPPTHQLISLKDAHLSAWDVLAHWYLRTLAPLPLASLIELILSRGKLYNSLKHHKVPGGLCHLQTTDGQITTSCFWKNIFKDTAEIPAIFSQSSLSITITLRSLNKWTELEGDLFQLSKDTSNIAHLVTLDYISSGWGIL